MPRVAPRIPDDTDILCEHCGYVLNGLPPDGRCPECGELVADSAGTDRMPTAWDVAVTASPGRRFAGVGPFVATTWQAIIGPKRFYRTLAVHAPAQSARSFAKIHWWIAGFLFATAAACHADWFLFDIGGARAFHVIDPEFAVFLAGLIGYTVGAYWVLDLTTRLAAKLTNWEGGYRGYRVPVDVVRRALYFHAAHYLPVAGAAAFTVVGFRVWWILEIRHTHTIPGDAAVPYLYTLCGQVIVSAIYLFQTYWTGMRNILYANR
jgi:hypothetical protein